MDVSIIEPQPEPTRRAGSGLQVWELVNETTPDRDLLIAYTIIPPGTSEGPHARDTDEFIWYLDGVAEIHVEGGDVVELRPGQLVRIPPGVSHSHVNAGSDPVVQLFFRAAPPT